MTYIVPEPDIVPDIVPEPELEPEIQKIIEPPIPIGLIDIEDEPQTHSKYKPQSEHMQLDSLSGWVKQRRYVLFGADPVGAINNKYYFQKQQTVELDRYIDSMERHIKNFFSDIEDKLREERDESYALGGYVDPEALDEQIKDTKEGLKEIIDCLKTDISILQSTINLNRTV